MSNAEQQLNELLPLNPNEQQLGYLIEQLTSNENKNSAIWKAIKDYRNSLEKLIRDKPDSFFNRIIQIISNNNNSTIIRKNCLILFQFYILYIVRSLPESIFPEFSHGLVSIIQYFSGEDIIFASQQIGIIFSKLLSNNKAKSTISILVNFINPNNLDLSQCIFYCLTTIFANLDYHFINFDLMQIIQIIQSFFLMNELSIKMRLILFNLIYTLTKYQQIVENLNQFGPYILQTISTLKDDNLSTALRDIFTSFRTANVLFHSVYQEMLTFLNETILPPNQGQFRYYGVAILNSFLKAFPQQFFETFPSRFQQFIETFSTILSEIPRDYLFSIFVLNF